MPTVFDSIRKYLGEPIKLASDAALIGFAVALVLWLVPGKGHTEVHHDEVLIACLELQDEAEALHGMIYNEVPEQVALVVLLTDEVHTGFQRHYLFGFVDAVYRTDTELPGLQVYRRVFTSTCMIEMGSGFMELPQKEDASPFAPEPHHRRGA